MTIDPAALNALTAQWAAQKADYDDSENRYRINYNNALDKLRRQQQQGMGNIAVNAADRGMTHSGIRGQQEVEQMDNMNTAQGLLSQQQQLALTTLARKRLEADNIYNTQKVLM